jgi:hypothetical protein
MDGVNSARKRQSGDSLLSWASSATLLSVWEEVSLAAAYRSLMLPRSVVYQGVTVPLVYVLCMLMAELVLRCVNCVREVGFGNKLSSSNLEKDPIACVAVVPGSNSRVVWYRRPSRGKCSVVVGSWVRYRHSWAL